MQYLRTVLIVFIVFKSLDPTAALSGINEGANDDNAFSQGGPKSSKVVKIDLPELNQIDADFQWKIYDPYTGWTMKCESDKPCKSRRSVSPDDDDSGKRTLSNPEIIPEKDILTMLKTLPASTNRSALIDLVRTTKLKGTTPLRLKQAMKNMDDSLGSARGPQKKLLKKSTLQLLKEADDGPKSNPDPSVNDDYNKKPSFLELMSVATKRKQRTL